MCAVGGIGEYKDEDVEVGSLTCTEKSRPPDASYVLQLVNQR